MMLNILIWHSGLLKPLNWGTPIEWVVRVEIYFAVLTRRKPALLLLPNVAPKSRCATRTLLASSARVTCAAETKQEHYDFLECPYRVTRF